EVGPLSDAARAQASFNLRQSVAQTELNQPLVSHPDNGDETLYADKCGSFTKCLPHDSFGRVNLAAYQTLLTALSTGNPADFANITMGGTNLLTNPQSGLAFDLEGTDGHNLTVPAALGTQPISQQWRVFLPGQDFLTTFSEWLHVQNGGSTGLTAAMDPQVRYPRNGRDLTAFAHVDVLSQAYFVALLALTTMNAPLNPGNPYIGSRTQGGFGTFGGGDFASTINEVASRALKAVWFQKWYVHRRLRPEATSGLVHLIKTGQGSNVSCNLNSTFLNSQAVQQSFSKYGTYLLSQAYPEGCPTHPSYPTGHGTVGGACITV